MGMYHLKTILKNKQKRIHIYRYGIPYPGNLSCPSSGNGRGEAGEAERLDEGQDDQQPTHELDVEEEPVCTFARTPKKRRGSPAPARKFSL